MLIHLSPRILRGHHQCVSMPIRPQRSIVAGIRGSNDLARCVLHSILDVVHRKFFPRVVTRSWVDDVVQRASGSASHVLHHLSRAGALFAQGARAKHVTISSQTTCISTHRATSHELAASLRSLANVPATAAESAPDLGIDRGRTAYTRNRPKGKTMDSIPRPLAQITPYQQCLRPPLRCSYVMRDAFSALLPLADNSSDAR